MGARRWVQDFLCGPRDEKVLLRSLDHLRAAKGNVSWGGGVGAVWNSWLQADLFLGGEGGGGRVRSAPIFYIGIYDLYFWLI